MILQSGEARSEGMLYLRQTTHVLWEFFKACHVLCPLLESRQVRSSVLGFFYGSGESSIFENGELKFAVPCDPL